jgi:hypothetical protein
MSEENITAEVLIGFLQEVAAARCPHCDRPVSPSDALRSRALGCRRRPRCLAGLAEFIGAEVHDLKAQLADYFSQRECYRSALAWAEARPDPTPGC